MKLGKRWARGLSVAVLAIGLQGCALATVGTDAAPDIYVLTTPDIDLGSERPPISLQVVIDEPYAPAALDSNRIVYQPSPNEIRYFAGARWSDRAPLMVQALLVDTLDRTGKFQAVGRRSAGMRSDFIVRMSIVTFAAEKSGSSTESVHVHFNAQLVRRFSDEIVAGRRFEAIAQPKSNNMLDIVNAFDDAMVVSLGDLSAWIYDEATQASAPAS